MGLPSDLTDGRPFAFPGENMQGAAVLSGRSPDPTPVTTAIRRARGALKAMHKSSPTAIDGPTPERVAQAGLEFEVGTAIRSVEVVKGGQRQVEQIHTPRAAVGSDPLTRLIARGELDREDEDMNRRLGAAALRYRNLSETAGRSEIRAQDFTKGFTTSAGPTERLDRALDAWTFWDRARASVQPQMRGVLDAVVLEGVKLEDAGAKHARLQDRKRGQTIGLVVLRLALAALDEHFDRVDANALDFTDR